MKPLVSICCTCYNHEKYIEATLDGFLMQKATFPIEIIIHDDASTDNSRKIIEKYAKLHDNIKTIFQSENQYSQDIKPLHNFLLPKTQGKYIAICEGDDYWIDTLKIKKQVDFLEANPDYVVSWTNYKTYNGINFKENHFNFKETNRTIDFDNIFSPYCTLTLTVLFKKAALDLKRIPSFKHFKDNTIYALLLLNGKGVYMDFVSAIYRQHSGGVYSLKSSYFKNYSSFLNIKEIIDYIPEANTSNMRKVLKSLGNAAAFKVLKLKQKGKPVTEDQLDFMLQYFSNANIKTKIKYYKRKLLKQTFKK
ncbi:glycosyltransferase [uncultured Algibacter sp.]|uniref:glycosyltransferase family 2 protein n=1 Tax=uncultured Algibacter sp. TaxID=298659 RepID=UPI003216EB67